ncbi:hypothetical protein [Brachyspira hyodysenteriae]|uniref:hypothetical protein n=1 Tax=Brachyspira hyodysenteriae TaxID=159 RepID=UPI00063DA654|nr:hypothetical protein [Brachyspira hyodysenteriae]KLI17169.1 hypothetical protein SU45_06375 [Brachyspira hyodysenteriae]KLI60832.1 hypothetical protein SZ46_05960 [Brachyspira hyodysenteriae]
MNDSKIIHIKKLGIAFYKDDFSRVIPMSSPELHRYGIYIYYKNGRYDFVKCKSQRQANLWVTLIVKKLNGEVK